MNAGADICHMPGISRKDARNLIMVMTMGSYWFQKAIATHSGVTLDAQVKVCIHQMVQLVTELFSS